MTLGAIGGSFGALSAQASPKAVFGFRWLKRGGAEYVGATLLREAQKHYGLDNVYVLLDQPEYEALDWLSTGTKVWAINDCGGSRPTSDRAAQLRQMLTVWRPKIVVNCNSSAMWDVYRESASDLKQHSRLYGFVFCFDYDSAGQPFGYAASHLAASLPHMEAGLMDNATFRSELITTRTIPPALADKLHVIYQPAELPDISMSDLRNRPQHGASPVVAWASRISRQKRPELLRAVAELRPDMQFRMYGDFYDAHLYSASDFALPNLTYSGWYRTLSDVPMEDVDAFLYTSAWDGMPNILLAAGGLGLSLVTADVGGVSEIIDADSGWLVKAHADAREYAIALDNAMSDKDEAMRRRRVLLDRLHARHTLEAFQARVRELRLFS